MIGVLPEAFVDPPDRSDTSDPKTPWLSTQPVGASRRSSDSERDASAFLLIFQPALPTSVTNQRYQPALPAAHSLWSLRTDGQLQPNRQSFSRRQGHPQDEDLDARCCALVVVAQTLAT